MTGTGDVQSASELTPRCRFCDATPRPGYAHACGDPTTRASADRVDPYRAVTLDAALLHGLPGRELRSIDEYSCPSWNDPFLWCDSCRRRNYHLSDCWRESRRREDMRWAEVLELRLLPRELLEHYRAGDIDARSPELPMQLHRLPWFIEELELHGVDRVHDRWRRYHGAPFRFVLGELKCLHGSQSAHIVSATVNEGIALLGDALDNAITSLRRFVRVD